MPALWIETCGAGPVKTQRKRPTQGCNRTMHKSLRPRHCRRGKAWKDSRCRWTWELLHAVAAWIGFLRWVDLTASLVSRTRKWRRQGVPAKDLMPYYPKWLRAHWNLDKPKVRYFRGKKLERNEENYKRRKTCAGKQVVLFKKRIWVENQRQDYRLGGFSGNHRSHPVHTLIERLHNGFNTKETQSSFWD